MITAILELFAWLNHFATIAFLVKTFKRIFESDDQKACVVNHPYRVNSVPEIQYKTVLLDSVPE